VRSGCIVLHHVADEGDPHVAVVVGRGAGGSVDRHRRQRQVRHVVADLWGSIPPGSLVVRVLPGIPAHGDLRRDLDRALGRL
jgi:ribonuclease P protein component